LARTERIARADGQLARYQTPGRRLDRRWLATGFIAGEQDTPGAPGRIRVNDQLRQRSSSKRPPASCRCSKP
jgi:hypothetical protein